VVAEEITERQRAEAALAASEARFRELAETLEQRVRRRRFLLKMSAAKRHLRPVLLRTIAPSNFAQLPEARCAFAAKAGGANLSITPPSLLMARASYVQ
jgi:hypothetical protein